MFVIFFIIITKLRRRPMGPTGKSLVGDAFSTFDLLHGNGRLLSTRWPWSSFIQPDAEKEGHPTGRERQISRKFQKPGNRVRMGDDV